MAWYTIEYRCGHTEEKQLYGKSASRQSKIDWYKTIDCPECRAKQATDLNGSTKQVAWAADIREETKAQLARDIDESLDLVRYAKNLIARNADTGTDDEDLTLLRKVETGDAVERIEAMRDLYDGIIAAHADARWWIDHRNTVSSKIWHEAREARPDLYTLDHVIIGIRCAKANIEHAVCASK